MKNTAIITDSNSGITQNQAKELGIFVLPMPFFINGELLFEDIDLTQDEFYKRLSDNADISTSQPAPGDVTALWNDVLKDYDEIVHIPMSSGLSSTCETAIMLAQDYDGKVQVVNNQRISVTLRQSVLDAREMTDNGLDAAVIKKILEQEKHESSIYITLDTLKYLKKGGRITPAAAAIGTVLNIKPVLQIQGEKLDSYAKARGHKQGKKIMLDAIQKDLKTRFSDEASEKRMHLQVAHTANDEQADLFVEEIKALYPGYDIHMDPLSLSIACHIGPGSLAIACSKYIEY